MNKTNKTPAFFHNKPIFGLDIGHGSLKVTQIDELTMKAGKVPRILGYGTTNFDKEALDNGVVVKPEVIAAATKELFAKHLVGDITTYHVAITIPSYRTFTRSLQLPKLKPRELDDAVQLEAEQYIPTPLEELYLDYTVISETKDATELFMVAVPKKIVDSYVELTQILGLEVVLIETTMNAVARLFKLDKQSDVPTVIIDFGSLSSDISIFNKTVLVTGTVQGGGEVFTNYIKSELGVTQAEAGVIKTKYGLGRSKKQTEIVAALEPTLELIIKEVRRMIRYYEEHYGTERPITQVITLGGGANMPGLNDYLTDHLRLAVRQFDPWQYVNYDGLQPPNIADRPMYATVAGLSLVLPKEVFEA